LFRITDVNDPAIYAISALPFSINMVIVKSPNGGEIWQGGSIQTIKWSAVNFTKVRIAFSSNNGGYWAIIADNLDASLGKYDWLIPDVPSNQCLIIVDSKSPANNDKSDALFTIDKQVGIEEEAIPTSYVLYQNYPNPFNPSTKIKFDLQKSNFTLSGAKGLNVLLIIYDIIGQEIATLVNEQLKPGSYEVEWNASNFPSGVYYYKLTAGDFNESKKMVLVK
jgi:hypothetical protein